jgi:hypothetical protein
MEANLFGPVILGGYIGLQAWVLYALVEVKTTLAELKTTLKHLGGK